MTVSYTQARFGYSSNGQKVNLTYQNAQKAPQGNPVNTISSDSFHAPEKALKFTSLSTSVANADMYLAGLEKKKAEDKQTQAPFTPIVPAALQSSSINPFYPVSAAKPIAPKPLRFGSEPFTMLWFKTQVSAATLDKVVGYLIDSISKTQQDQANELAIQYLRNAKNSTSESDKRDYLQRAEGKLLKVAKVKVGFFDSSSQYGTKAHAYKELAILAKALGRGQGVVDDYVEQCMESYEKYAGHVKAIATDRQQLANPAMHTLVTSGLSALQGESKVISAYEKDDTASVCTQLHSRRYFSKPSVEPDRCVVM